MESKQDEHAIFESLSPTVQEFFLAGAFQDLEEALRYQHEISNKVTTPPTNPSALPAIAPNVKLADLLSIKLGTTVQEAQRHLSEINEGLRVKSIQNTIVFLLLNKISFREVNMLQPIDRLSIAQLSYWLLIERIKLTDVRHYTQSPDIIRLFNLLHPEDLVFLHENFSKHLQCLNPEMETQHPISHHLAQNKSSAASSSKVSAQITCPIEPLTVLIDHHIATPEEISALSAEEYTIILEWLPWIVHTQKTIPASLYCVTQLQILQRGKQLYACTCLVALDKLSLAQIAGLTPEQLYLLNNLVHLLIVGLIHYDQLLNILAFEEELFSDKLSLIQNALASLTPSDLSFLAMQTYPDQYSQLSPVNLPADISIEHLLAYHPNDCVDLLKQLVCEINQKISISSDRYLNKSSSSSAAVYADPIDQYSSDSRFSSAAAALPDSQYQIPRKAAIHDFANRRHLIPTQAEQLSAQQEDELWQMSGSTTVEKAYPRSSYRIIADSLGDAPTVAIPSILPPAPPQAFASAAISSNATTDSEHHDEDNQNADTSGSRNKCSF